MKTLLVVRAPGLTPDQAVRGDMAWTISDLIADGSYAPLATPPDVPGAVAGLGAGDRVRVVDLPYADAAAFDEALGKLREESGGAAIAILSDRVFISSHWFREIKPGASLQGADVPRLLAEILGPAAP